MDLDSDRMKRCRWARFDFVARTSILVQSATTVSLGWLAPTSLTARILAEGDGTGRCLLWAMTIVTLAGLADAVVNDLMPESWQLECIQRNRHIGFMLLGAAYLVQAFAGLGNSPGGAHVLLANYVGVGGVCGLFAAAAAVRPSHAL